jgi:hypothetical protein
MSRKQKNRVASGVVITLVACVISLVWLASTTEDERTATATPAPVTETPEQGNVFAVENPLGASGGLYTVSPGEQVRLRWHVADGEEVYIKQEGHPGDGDAVFGPLPPAGTLEVCPLPYDLFFLYVDANPDSEGYVPYDLSLATLMDIDHDTPIDPRTACWGAEGDYLVATAHKALMNDQVFLLWSVSGVEAVSMAATTGAGLVHAYDALPPSGMLAVCESDDVTYTLLAGDAPSLQVTVSRANTAYYVANKAYGDCPYEGIVPSPE